MTADKKFLIVKKHVDRMDYYALLAGGAPNDEFDSESREISRQIHKEQSVQELADIMAEVFNRSFHERDESALFLPVAEHIMKELFS